MGGIKGLFKGNFALLRKWTALLYQFCDLRVFPPLKEFTSVPLSFGWLLVIFPLFWLVPVIKNHCAYFFVNWQEYILEVSQKSNKNDFLVTEADVFSPSFPFYFFFPFQEVTWAKMWIRRRWPNSINRWPRWWTPGFSNKWVRVQCDQPEFFNKFLCMKTFFFAVKLSSPVTSQLHRQLRCCSFVKNKAQMAVIHTGKRSILLSPTVAQFYFRRYL